MSRIWEGPTDDGRQLTGKKTLFFWGRVFNIVIIIVDVVGYAINITGFELKGTKKIRILCRFILLNWISANTSNSK